MTVQEGLLLINGVDMATYGTFLCETSAGAHTNYDALMKPSKTKAPTSVSYQERNGEELPDDLGELKHEARDVSLQVAIVGDTRQQWFSRYNALMALLQSGWLNINVPELGRIFKMYLKDCSDYSQLTTLSSTGQQIATMKVVLREPKPEF